MKGKSINFEVKVGIFVFLGLVLMFIIVFSIGEFYLLKPMYTVKMVFGFINGMAVGAPVRLAGVEVGEVENIRVYYDDALARTKVLITAKITNEAKVERNAFCGINTLGLLGEKYLEISPGTRDAGFIQDGDTIMGKDPIPMEEITKTMKELSDNARAITDSARAVLQRLEKGEGTVGKLLTDETVYNNLEDFTDDIKRHPWKLLMKGKETPAAPREEEKAAPGSKSNISTR